MAFFSPSLMCMNLSQFEYQIRFLDVHADYFHVDIMDGHFVPNLTLSPFFISEARKLTNKIIDAHLMVEDPVLISTLCIDAGADMISFHPETTNGKAFRLIDSLQKKGCKVGVVLNPETPIIAAEDYYELADKVTIMTVDPGFAGQPFIMQSLRKISQVRDLKVAKGYHFKIEIDGSCNAKTFSNLIRAGSEGFVLGNSGLFSLDSDIEKAWSKMLDNFNSALENLSNRIC